MSQSVELDLVGGGRISLGVQAPVAMQTCYVLLIQNADANWLWPVVQRIFVAGGRPVSDYAAELRRLRVSERDLTPDSLFDLLKSQGRTFGPIRDPAPLRPELDAIGRKSLLFIRDPRDIVAELRAASAATSGEMFLTSPRVLGFLAHCRRLAEFCRAGKHVTTLRLEDAARDVQAFARDIAMATDVRLAPAVLSSIAADIPRASSPASFSGTFDSDHRLEIETMFAEVLACFGYVPSSAPTAAFLHHWDAFSRAISSRLATKTPASMKAGGPQRDGGSGTQPASPMPASQGLVEFDPELLWRLRINATKQSTVLGRNVVLQTDAFGRRPVLDQPDAGEKTLAAYGCSYTFGVALPFDETFCSVLQSLRPGWRIENHGTGAYGTVQNLIQLRRASRWSTPDYVTFCFIPSHLLRNVADIAFRRTQMTEQTRSQPQQLYPRGALDENGKLQFRYVSHPRWDLDGLDLSDFSQESHYLDVVTAGVFERAADIVRQSGAHFFVTTLQGGFSPYLRGRLDAAGIPVLDASVAGLKYTCLPDDGHPNTAANRIYADRIHAYLTAREAAPAIQA